MNKKTIIFLCLCMVSTNNRGAQKNKVFITNNCSRSIKVYARLLGLEAQGTFFFAKIEPQETIGYTDALVINELQIKDLKKDVYIPVLWGDSISFVQESSDDISVYAKNKKD